VASAEAAGPPADARPADASSANGHAAPDTPPRQAAQSSAPWEGDTGRTTAPPWELDSDDSGWPASAEQPVADALWQPPATPAPDPGSAGAESMWQPPAAQASWDQPAAEGSWDQPAAEASWEPPAADADTGQFSWHPSAQTDTFPAIGDDA
jgi:hypothetical protein